LPFKDAQINFNDTQFMQYYTDFECAENVRSLNIVEYKFELPYTPACNTLVSQKLNI